MSCCAQQRAVNIIIMMIKHMVDEGPEKGGYAPAAVKATLERPDYEGRTVVQQAISRDLHSSVTYINQLLPYVRVNVSHCGPTPLRMTCMVR